MTEFRRIGMRLQLLKLLDKASQASGAPTTDQLRAWHRSIFGSAGTLSPDAGREALLKDYVREGVIPPGCESECRGIIEDLPEDSPSLEGRNLAVAAMRRTALARLAKKTVKPSTK